MKHQLMNDRKGLLSENIEVNLPTITQKQLVITIKKTQKNDRKTQQNSAKK